MSLSDLTDSSAVLLAVDEYDALGRDAFLGKYGFGKATDYFLLIGDKKYDSKAIVGASHAFQHGTALRSDEFSGGDATVASQLEKLGFEVSRPMALPDWSPDERMLALDLYLRTRGSIGYGKQTPIVQDLSATLRLLRIFPDDIRANPRFRNTSGVALKLHNFEAIDPDHSGTGMTNLAAGDLDVWKRWSGRPEQLAAAAAVIRSRGTADDALGDTGEDEEYSAVEGRILYREHRRYERDRKLVAAKKKAVLKATGRLACEVCMFDSAREYGLPGVIDVHHVIPLYAIGESTTTLEDLALVCPTCHRVLHKHDPFIAPRVLTVARQRPPFLAGDEIRDPFGYLPGSPGGSTALMVEATNDDGTIDISEPGAGLRWASVPPSPFASV